MWKKITGIIVKTLPWGAISRNIKDMVKNKQWTELILYIVFGGAFIYLIARGLLTIEELKGIVDLLKDLVG